MKKNILVIAAHPDDEVLGCGGTIARLVRGGHTVSVLILGEGPLSRYVDRTVGKQQNDVAKVSQFTARAAAALGIAHVFPFQFPDNAFDTVPLLEIIRAISSVKDTVRPDTVFTHSRADLNIDHRRTYEAVITACRPIAGETVREIYSFEIPSSTEWNVPMSFAPTKFVDIAATLETKIAALQCYETEVRPFPFPRSPEALRAIAMRWGSVSACAAAEAFEVIRFIE